MASVSRSYAMLFQSYRLHDKSCVCVLVTPALLLLPASSYSRSFEISCGSFCTSARMRRRRSDFNPSSISFFCRWRVHRMERRQTVGYAAERLGVRHKSVVELSERCEEAGLISRKHVDPDRRCIVPMGERKRKSVTVNSASVRRVRLRKVRESRKINFHLATIMDVAPLFSS